MNVFSILDGRCRMTQTTLQSQLSAWRKAEIVEECSRTVSSAYSNCVILIVVAVVDGVNNSCVFHAKSRRDLLTRLSPY